MSEPGRRPVERMYSPNFLIELFHNPLDAGYADAAARRRVSPPGPGQVAVGRAALIVTLLVVGVLLAVAYRQTVAEEPSRSKVRADLVEKIKERERGTSQLQQRAEVLRADVARQHEALAGGEASRLREQAAAAGLARVRGDGLVVRIADAPEEPDAVTGAGDTNLGRVYDRDLQAVANTLWSAGAEAIAVNGQRLTATSPIRAAGGAILVGFQPVLGPYEVSAIGPSQLESRFADSDTSRLLRRLADEHGMGFQVRSAEDLVLPAAGEPGLLYATPAAAPRTGTPGPSTTSRRPATGASPTASGGDR
jgi:uncharacterized protein YlxW (UPF0749 family)